MWAINIIQTIIWTSIRPRHWSQPWECRDEEDMVPPFVELMTAGGTWQSGWSPTEQKYFHAAICRIPRTVFLKQV